MIPYRSLWSNTKFANDNLEFIRSGDNIVCMLPMAHTCGLAFEILNSSPWAATYIFWAKPHRPKCCSTLCSVKPKLVLAVPLIIEKIVTRNVFPKLKEGARPSLSKYHSWTRLSMPKSKNRWSISSWKPGRSRHRRSSIKLRCGKFSSQGPFPLPWDTGWRSAVPISYAFWSEYKERSSGRVVDRMQVKIDSPHPENVAGEIWWKGPT